MSVDDWIKIEEELTFKYITKLDIDNKPTVGDEVMVFHKTMNEDGSVIEMLQEKPLRFKLGYGHVIKGIELVLLQNECCGVCYVKMWITIWIWK